MTELIYDRDSHVSHFDATITSCRNDETGIYVTLDKTAFFAEGGGQKCDTGTIGAAACGKVSNVCGEVRHYVDRALTVGESVECEIDYAARFLRMQCHSGEHIVSAAVHRMFGYDNVGFHLADDYVTCDFNGPMTAENVRTVEKTANEMIWKNVPVRVWYPTSDELRGLEYRSKLDLKENVRIVEIEGYDRCACCAPHVKSTGEIGLIKIIDCVKWKGGVRMTLVCGAQALADYETMCENASAISAELCVPRNQASDAVRKLNEGNVSKDHEITQLKLKIVAGIVERQPSSDGDTVMFFDGGYAECLRTAVVGCLDKCAGICAAFSGDGTEYTFAVGSSDEDVKPFVADMTKTLGGRGGGSNFFAYGKLTCGRSEIEAYFEKRK